MADRRVDELLSQIRSQMDLESETEWQVLAELRLHLEEALADSQAKGLDSDAALSEVLQAFGSAKDVGQELQRTHLGWGTADGVLATMLPVLCALVLRWLAFAPDGTALGWPELLNRPSFWVVALVMLIVPLFRFGRWRYAAAGWVIFWGLTVLIVAWPGLRW